MSLVVDTLTQFFGHFSWHVCPLDCIENSFFSRDNNISLDYLWASQGAGERGREGGSKEGRQGGREGWSEGEREGGREVGKRKNEKKGSVVSTHHSSNSLKVLSVKLKGLFKSDFIFHTPLFCINTEWMELTGTKELNVQDWTQTVLPCPLNL